MSLVSVVMNCHNSQLYLRDSLNSLLNQKYGNWELIFLDNSSTDNTKKIFKSFKDKRFRYFYLNKKEPLGIARFKALKKAKGSYICFLDSDDIFLPEKIYKQIKILKNSDAGFSITNSIFFNEKKEEFLYKRNLTYQKNVFYELIKNYFISFDTVMIKKNYLKKLDHTFDKNFNIIHDCDLLIRLSKISKMEYIPEALSKWRVHKNGESFKKFSTINKEKINLIKKLDKYYIKDPLYLVNRSFFLDSVYRNEILNKLLNNQSIFFFRDISQLKFSIKNFLLILLIFIPFRNFFINKILSNRVN
jgi:glycosyltransferase involved in cell wall biosynthesis